MPFIKGQGGRPSGARNRVTKDVRDVFEKLGGKDGQLYAQKLHDLAVGVHDDPAVRIKALSIIAPYLWGKPTEHIALSDGQGGPIQIRFVDA